MNQILYSEKNTKISIIKISVALVVLLILIIIVSAIISKQLEGKILANVYIGDIDVGMQTKEDALNSISPTVNKYQGATLKLVLNDKTIDVKAEDIGFGLENNIENMIENAYSYGRDGNFLKNTVNVVKSYFDDTKIELKYTFDDKKLTDILNGLSNENKDVSSDDTYEISGDKIFIYKGADGKKIDEELTKKYIVTAFLNQVNSIDVPLVERESNRLDLERIYDEIYVAPQNASYTLAEKFILVADKSGKYFELEEAKKQYEELKENEKMTIQIKAAEAEIKVSDLDKELYSTVLATYSSTYDEADKDRVTNLKVASERCNMILYPGDEFSYNKALGTRTIANGFAPGHSFAGGRVVTTIGGGICQVSSSLYNVVLMADLEVTNRVAHGMYVEYVKPSLDATVVDGAIDFKFKNNRKYPVKIEAVAENGIVKVSLLGIKEQNEPIIEIESVVLETLEYKTVKENDASMNKGTTKIVQEPVNGYVSEAYRIEKDKNGNVISRTLISKDRYIPTNEIIKVGTKEEIIIIAPVEQEKEEKEETNPILPNENMGNIIYDEDEGLPEGWDSPESPYANGN